ncbi:hypothetical protein PVAG01_06139 [Phlyctema vagabunda]|uniref:Uncharacterized protein n=1 Tax=Phlyctema vagabunda TaxID=108571 RepID=A0ABR4PF85_9HELO
MVRLSLCQIHKSCVMSKDVGDASNLQHLQAGAAPISLSIIQRLVPSSVIMREYPARTSSLRNNYSSEMPVHMPELMATIRRYDTGYETIIEDPSEESKFAELMADLTFDNADVITRRDYEYVVYDDIDIINKYEVIRDMASSTSSTIVDSDEDDDSYEFTDSFEEIPAIATEATNNKTDATDSVSSLDEFEDAMDGFELPESIEEPDSISGVVAIDDLDTDDNSSEAAKSFEEIITTQVEPALEIPVTGSHSPLCGLYVTSGAEEPFPSFDNQLAYEDFAEKHEFEKNLQKVCREHSVEKGCEFIFNYF